MLVPSVRDVMRKASAVKNMQDLLGEALSDGIHLRAWINDHFEFVNSSVTIVGDSDCDLCTHFQHAAHITNSILHHHV